MKERRAAGGVLPPKLLFALVVMGIENTEEGPRVTLDKLGPLRNELMGRLEVLGPGEVVAGVCPGAWMAFI